MRMTRAVRWMSVAAIGALALLALAGSVACMRLVAEHDMRVGKWYIHYIVYALPGLVAGGGALLALAFAAPPRSFRRALVVVAALGLAPSVCGVAWLLLR